MERKEPHCRATTQASIHLCLPEEWVWTLVDFIATLPLLGPIFEAALASKEFGPWTEGWPFDL